MRTGTMEIPTMPKGGSRVGAGRKPGSRERVRTSAEIVKEYSGKKQLPLHYMLKVLNDPAQDQTRRDQMAIAAAPYCHAKLHTQAIVSETTVTYVARLPSPIQDLEEWEKQTKLLLKPH
jgi:hypothetical protein